jgi:flagellin
MSINSVNTNNGAMIALQSLNRTNTDLAATEKRVSTGFRVADSTDDGAAYAVAQSVRSTIGALTTANQQLGNVQGLLSTTQTGLNSVSKAMASMRDVLLTLANGNVSGNQRTQYISQYQSLLTNVKTFINDATYAGKTLIGNITSAAAATGAWNAKVGYCRVAVVRNDQGASYGIATFGSQALYGKLNIGHVYGVTAGGLVTAGMVAAFSVGAMQIIANGTAAGSFQAEQNLVGFGLNTVGSEINYVANQIGYNSDKVDALNSGLGSLVDADLAKESAQLQALQIRQQLGTQALSLANQAPQTLLSLFK